MAPEMHTVDSTTIEAVGYDAESQELHVRFTSGRNYVYFGVDQLQHRRLMRAESKGSYFNHEIRPHYDFEERPE